MVATLKNQSRKSKRYVGRAWGLLVAAGLSGCQDPNPREDTLSSEVPTESGEDFAVRFDGTSDYATMGTARFSMPTLPQCISLWLKLGSKGTRQAILTLRRDDSGNVLGLSETGVVTLFRIWNPEVLVEASEPLDVERWYHLAYVHNEDTHLLYVDGVLKGSSTAGPDNRSPTSGWLGTFDGQSQLFHGELDELRVWSIARTALDITSEFTEGGAVADPELVGYYSFNESSGATVYDRSGNGNHVALGDGVTDYMPQRVRADRP